MLSTLCKQTKNQRIINGLWHASCINRIQNIHSVSEQNIDSLQYKATLSYFALQKSKDVINNFAENACIHYDVKLNDFYKKHIDSLMYFTGIMYECDEQNEREIRDKLWNKDNIYDNDNLLTLNDTEMNDIINSNECINDMILFLKDNNFYDKKVENEIKNALLYWKLEKFLCNDKNWESKRAEKESFMINEDLIQKTMSYRLFYFNVMNLMFCKMMNKSTDGPFQKNLDFLKLHENMYAIYDDLMDYKTDLKNSSFNIYIMYKKLCSNNIEKTKENMKKYIDKIESIYQNEKRNIDELIINQYEHGFKRDYNTNVINTEFNYFV